MPLLATNEKEQCCAFDRSDHRRCRLIREPEKLTCKIHKTYYVNWHTKHPPLIDILLSKRIEEEYRFQYKNGYVELDYPGLLNFAMNVNVNSYRKYFRILLETTSFSLKDCPYILSTLIATDFGPNIPMPFETHLATITSLMYVFKDPETLLMFLEHLTIYIVNYSFTSTTHSHTALTYSTIVNSHLPWSSLLYADSISQILPRTIRYFHENFGLTQEHRDFIDQFTKLYLEPTLDNFHHSHRHLIRYRCEQIKEELIAEVCHPRRIQKLIDQHGLDILEDI